MTRGKMSRKRKGGRRVEGKTEECIKKGGRWG